MLTVQIDILTRQEAEVPWLRSDPIENETSKCKHSEKICSEMFLQALMGQHSQNKVTASNALVYVHTQPLANPSLKGDK